jgi:hypothetical protein
VDTVITELLSASQEASYPGIIKVDLLFYVADEDPHYCRRSSATAPSPLLSKPQRLSNPCDRTSVGSNPRHPFNPIFPFSPPKDIFLFVAEILD